MGLNGTSSSGLAALCCTLVFAALQVYRVQLASTRVMTLIAGYASSWLFIFMLICINSLEQVMFGSGFQAQLPEVMFCLIISCSVAGMVHRVSSTVCLLSSLVALYFISRISSRVYQYSTSSSSSLKRKK